MPRHQPQPRVRPSPASSSQSSTRKDTVRLHTLWTIDVDEIDLARSSLGFVSPGAVVRGGSCDICSIANIQKLSGLQEIFSDLPIDIMEDVLIPAQFRVDIAASILSDISRELDQQAYVEVPERAIDTGAWTAIHEDDFEDLTENDYWHDVSASLPEMQQWIIVQDDWEVVESDVTAKSKVRSFADVLRGSSVEGPAQYLPSLMAKQPSVSRLPLIRQKNADIADEDEAVEELSGKSFGSRKRHSLRKHRGWTARASASYCYPGAKAHLTSINPESVIYLRM